MATALADADLPLVSMERESGGPLPIIQVSNELRGRAALARSPFVVYVLQRDDVARLLHDPRLRGPGLDILRLQGITDGPLYDSTAEVLLFMEGEDHHRLRGLVARTFTPKAIDRLRPMMRASFAERFDEVAAAGRCDAVPDLCERYPIDVICALLGAPADDWPLFSRWAEGILRSLAFDIGEHRPYIEQCLAEINDHIDGLVEQKRREPGADILSDLIAVEEQGDRLTPSELRAVARVILVAGSDTTRNQLALSLHTFATHPDQWRLLQADPPLAARAVEETMRYIAATGGLARVALEDVEVAGVVIPAGTMVVLDTVSANHDPNAIDHPDTVDLTRDVPAGYHHLTFGGGVHYCLGASLARAELQEALAICAERMPDLALDGEPTWKPNLGIFGPASLPLRWSVR